MMLGVLCLHLLSSDLSSIINLYWNCTRLIDQDLAQHSGWWNHISLLLLLLLIKIFKTDGISDDETVGGYFMSPPVIVWLKQLARFWPGPACKQTVGLSTVSWKVASLHSSCILDGARWMIQNRHWSSLEQQYHEMLSLLPYFHKIPSHCNNLRINLNSILIIQGQHEGVGPLSTSLAGLIFGR